MFPRLERFHHKGSMAIMRRGNHDRVDMWILQQLMIIGCTACKAVAFGGCTGVGAGNIRQPKQRNPFYSTQGREQRGFGKIASANETYTGIAQANPNGWTKLNTAPLEFAASGEQYAELDTAGAIGTSRCYSDAVKYSIVQTQVYSTTGQFVRAGVWNLSNIP